MNKNKTHPIMGNLKHLHAECDAILQVKDSRKIVGSKIYVVRVNVNGKIGMARPCPICLSTLKEYGVAEMSYTDRAGNIILEKVN
jgi:cytidine deaminase